MEDGMKYFYHGFLKQRWNRFLTERYDFSLKMMISNTKTSFFPIIWADS